PQTLETLGLEGQVPDCQDLVEQEDLGIGVDGDRESEAKEHSRRVELDGRVDEVLQLGEGDDVVETPVQPAPLHAQQQTVEVHVVAAGQLSTEAHPHPDERSDPSGHPETTLARPGDTGEKLEQGGLSGSIPPDDP